LTPLLEGVKGKYTSHISFGRGWQTKATLGEQSEPKGSVGVEMTLKFV